MMGMEPLLCNHCKKDFVGLRFHHSCKRFKIVNTFTLLKALWNTASFIPFDIIFNISFSLESPFGCQHVLICSAFDKFPSIISNKRVISSLYSFFLFSSLTTLHSLFKTRLIWCKALPFACNLNKPLKSLRWHESQQIMKESLTSRWMWRIV